MEELLERELKLDVDEQFTLPPLDDVMAGADVEHSTVSLDNAYYDTADGDLQTHGVVLRRRDGDDDIGWQLKVPHAHGRVEIRTGLTDKPPAELTELLTGLRLGKPLVNVATIRTVRDRYRIREPEHHQLCAEVADDHVRHDVRIVHTAIDFRVDGIESRRVDDGPTGGLGDGRHVRVL